MLKALILLGFFGFYRLSTLVPPSVSAFSITRFPTNGDVVWAPPPGVHIITKCSKSMQISGQVHVVQLPALQDKAICPVAALKAVVSANTEHKDQPIFTVATRIRITRYDSQQSQIVFQVISSSYWPPPSDFGFHSLRKRNHIKVHGGWRSDAIWRYLIRTPAAASQ